MSQVQPTDTLPFDDLPSVLLGLFGEVGSIMATAKKFHREREAYAGYRHAVEEEFGDALWYFTALCRRLEIPVDEILAGAASGENYATSVLQTRKAWCHSCYSSRFFGAILSGGDCPPDTGARRLVL
jgi:hypothetical protein